MWRRVRPEAEERRGPSIHNTGIPWQAQPLSKETQAAQELAARRGEAGPSTTHTQSSQTGTHWQELFSALYHWTTCLFITGLVLSQLLGMVWDSKTTIEHLIYGSDPLFGPYQIVGSNDVPYTDRIIVCVRHGEFYEPKVVSSLLAAEGVDAVLEDDTGTAVSGYRVVQRHTALTTDALDSTTQEVYLSSCALIAATLDNILNGCLALGYSNLTRDVLRVVDDWDSNRLFRLPNTLPVLIMPFWDNSVDARHAVPTWGGDACVFRLRDAYASSAGDVESHMARLVGVNQSVRHERTIEWLDRPGGIWKNGWYEDPTGVSWYSDVVGSAPGPPFNMMHRIFDTRSGLEVDCSDSSACEDSMRVEQWGENLRTISESANVTSVTIANGAQFGFFFFAADAMYTVISTFDWETLVSNVSVGTVLTRWVSTLLALHIGAFQGKSQWFGGGIGCVANAGSFAMLPLTTLPRLKMTLAAFWTVGCRFEGQQSGLSEAWFAVYPAITQLVLVYFSLLNLLAKVLRRRMSDALFGPTVAALCLLHYFRLELATSGWLADIDGRVPTVVFSDEVQQLQLADYFTTDMAWRMNGRVKLLFAVKLGLLGVNLVPLLLARPFPIVKRGSDPGLEGVEKALALRIKHVGGLGLSRTYIVGRVDSKQREIVATTSGMVGDKCSSVQDSEGGGEVENSLVPIATPVQMFKEVDTSVENSFNSGPSSIQCDKVGSWASFRSKQELKRVVLVNTLEIVRLGYIVYGDKYLITFDEWNLLSSMALFRSFCHLWNHRVIVWTLEDAQSEGDAEAVGERALMDTNPEMWRLDDPRLQSVRWWQISGCAIQC